MDGNFQNDILTPGEITTNDVLDPGEFNEAIQRAEDATRAETSGHVYGAGHQSNDPMRQGGC